MPTQKGDENDNTLTGGAGKDLLYGLGGNDVLYGNGGNDTLDGGTGDDQMEGGAGNDIYYVDSFYDYAFELPDSGTDEVRSSVALFNAFDDVENYKFLTSDNVTFIANGLDNEITGNSGNDYLDGQDGKDKLVGGDGDDTLVGDAGDDTLDGGNGNDVLFGGIGDDKMTGGKGDDVYIVDSLGDVVKEGSNGGIDEIRTELQLKGVVSGVENYMFYGELNYTFTGNGQDNHITGSYGNDTLAGAGGNDRLDGSDGDDVLQGGSGDDTLDGGTGADTMTGGAGNDVYYVDQPDDVVIEGKNQGIDEIRSATQIAGPVTNVENYAFIGFESIEFTGDKGDNRITGDQGQYTFSGGAGNDTILGGSYYATENGDAGNDTLYAAAGGGDLHGGDGNDRLIGSTAAATELNGDAGNDIIIGGASFDTISGGTGNDTIDGGGDSDSLDGGDGNDTITGGGGDDGITGGAGKDTLIGGAGSDYIDAGDGNDTVVISNLIFQQVLGGAGTDTLQTTGRFAFDLALFAGSTIQDIERIDLSQSGLDVLTLNQAAVHDVSSSTDRLIVDGNKGDIVLLDSAFKFSGTAVNGGETYDVYKAGGDSLLLDQVIKVNPPAPLTVFHLAGLDGTNGFRMDGYLTTADVGFITSPAGDINGDGFDDFILGPAGADPAGGEPYNVAAYVIYGSATGPSAPVDLSKLDGSNGFTLINPPNSVLYGPIVSGDFNGDGKPDIVTGRPDHTYVVFGQGAPAGASIDISTLDGTNGFDATFGRPVAYGKTTSFGDINGDGFDDLVIGGFSVGVEVVLGHAGASDPSVSVADIQMYGSRTFGYSVSAAGDFNGDGFDDLFIGDPDENTAYVVFGHADGTPWISSPFQIDGKNGFALSGAPTGEVGQNIRSGGDLNGDGLDDLVIGSDFGGTTYVVYGHAGGSPTVDLNALDGTNGSIISNIIGNGTVSAAGDFNGDGYDDLIVGAPNNGPDSNYSGEAYLIYGSEAGLGASVDLQSLNGYNGFKIEGEAPQDEAGWAVSSAGDVNGDGYDDLLVGAWHAQPNGVNGAGSGYIIYGHDTLEQVAYQGTTGNDTHTGTSDAEIMIGGLGNDTLSGGGGADTIRAGAGNDQIHVSDHNFHEANGGGGNDTLHFDFAGSIDLGNIDGNAATSDRGKISGVEVLDFTNGQANSVTLHALDLLGLDVSNTDVGGVSGLNNVLKIDGNAGDTLHLSSADGWGSADTGTLAGYAIYTQGVNKIAVESDISVSFA